MDSLKEEQSNNGAEMPVRGWWCCRRYEHRAGVAAIELRYSMNRAQTALSNCDMVAVACNSGRWRQEGQKFKVTLD